MNQNVSIILITQKTKKIDKCSFTKHLENKQKNLSLQPQKSNFALLKSSASWRN